MHQTRQALRPLYSQRTNSASCTGTPHHNPLYWQCKTSASWAGTPHRDPLHGIGGAGHSKVRSTATLRSWKRGMK
eukprot:1500431-Lingulodinium_polyedra.AAC.1